MEVEPKNEAHRSASHLNLRTEESAPASTSVEAS
jgi:hypothetical protein